MSPNLQRVRRRRPRPPLMPVRMHTTILLASQCRHRLCLSLLRTRVPQHLALAQLHGMAIRMTAPMCAPAPLAHAQRSTQHDLDGCEQREARREAECAQRVARWAIAECAAEELEGYERDLLIVVVVRFSWVEQAPSPRKRFVMSTCLIPHSHVGYS